MIIDVHVEYRCISFCLSKGNYYINISYNEEMFSNFFPKIYIKYPFMSVLRGLVQHFLLGVLGHIFSWGFHFCHFFILSMIFIKCAIFQCCFIPRDRTRQLSMPLAIFQGSLCEAHIIPEIDITTKFIHCFYHFVSSCFVLCLPCFCFSHTLSI